MLYGTLPDQMLHDSNGKELLDMINSHLKQILPLRNIVIQIDVFDDQYVADDFITGIHDFEWKLEFRERKREKEIFFDERGVAFDNEEDLSQRMYEIEREEEEEFWREEYWRRRQDPFWKNDSDFD